MPTSNGLITSRDIRRRAVQSQHIVDASIETAKIADLAVTFPDKLDDPIWSSAFGGLLFHNETLTTTPTVFGATTIDIPAWVDGVSVLAIGYFQMSNTSGGTQTVFPGIEIDGEVRSGNTLTIPTSTTSNTTTTRVTNLSGVAGSTLTVSMEVFLSTGTNTANFGLAHGIVVGTRG